MSTEMSDIAVAHVTFEDLGIPKRPSIRDTVLGKTRKWGDVTKLEIAFLVISLLSLSGALVMTIYNVAAVFKPTDPDFTFGLILILHMLFCAYYILHGVFDERPYELLVFAIATGLLMVYIVINYVAKGEARTTVKLVRLIILIVVGPVDMGLGIFILVKYFRQNKLIFRTVGATTELQAACKILYAFETCLKLDLQLECTLLLLILHRGTFTSVIQKVVLGIGFPFSIGWLILGFVATRMEQKIATIVFLSASWCEPAYIVYVIVKCAETDGGLMLDVATYLCSGCALVMRVLVIALVIKIYKNFGSGLREKVCRLERCTTETE